MTDPHDCFNKVFSGEMAGFEGRAVTGLTPPGAVCAHGICAFSVWAPYAERVDVHFVAPTDRLVPLERGEEGYFHAKIDEVAPGSRYFYRLDGKVEAVDPASREQPDGVHAASQIVDNTFRWTDQNWFGVPLRSYIIYELHVGTFSKAGTFDGVVEQLGRLKDLGITAIEIMPVAQFPGARNWGYDGVGLYAVQNSYGGPAGLKRLVNAAHEAGLAVILDVVYNHLGPEGNYLNLFGPYFTDTYRTPWGRALNFDGANSGPVRRFFIENALYWQTEFHIDALRLDAVHAIRDISAIPFLRELGRAVRARAEKLNRRFYLIAETDLNAPRFILPESFQGYGMDAQWADDFHHCLHTLLTGESNGYYSDYTGGVVQLAKTWRQGYAYTGEYSEYRKARHGDAPRLNPYHQFVVCSQNHDQIGNRMLGERLSVLVDHESLKVAAGCVLLSPFVPLLFMGEEYGERAPFQFFVSHTDDDLIEAVRSGRKEEFASFGWDREAPDPFSQETFRRCRISPEAADKKGATLLVFYKELIRIRKAFGAITLASREDLHTRAVPSRELVWVHYFVKAEPELLLLVSFSEEDGDLSSLRSDFPEGNWNLILDSADTRWGGPGAVAPANLHGKLRLRRRSLALYAREGHSD